MLSRLFAKNRKLLDERAHVRREFLEALDGDKAAGMQEALLDALKAESDADNRLLILDHLSDLSPITELLDAEHGQQYAAYLAAHVDRANDAQKRHPKVVRQRIADAENPAPLLSEIEDGALILDLAVTLRGDAQQHALAHPALQSVEALQALEQGSRGHDKRANRYARERLQEIRGARESAQTVRQRLTQLSDTATRVAAEEPATASAREIRRTHLVALKREHEDALVQLDSANQALTALGQPTEDRPETTPFDSLDLTPPEASPYNTVLATLPEVNPNLDHDTIDQSLAAAAEEWQALRSVQAPPQDLADRYAASTESLAMLSTALRKLEDTDWPQPPEEPRATSRWIGEQSERLKRIGWPPNVDQPDTLTQQHTILEEARARLKSLAEASQRQISAVQETLETASTAIDSGASKEARQQLLQIRDLIASLPEDQARKYEKHLNALFARLNELRDWETFATSPKRDALIESMKALIGDERAPQALADQIKTLRQSWNALGRPANRHEHELQRAFDAAAEAAFEPCKTYFAELGEARKANLAKREALVEQLARYLETVEWSSTDLSAAEQIMRTARREWRDAFPVPRGADKALTTRFESLQDSLHGQLKKVGNANADAKQGLIDQAQALLNGDDLRAQIDGVKSLQAQWKAVGPVPRKQDQKLWKSFREICDQVFDARKQASDAQQADFEARRAQAQSLNAEFEATFDQPASRNALTEYQRRFADIGNLGRDGKPLQDAHRSLAEQYETLIENTRRSRQGERLKTIRAEDERLSALEANGEQPDSELPEFRDRCTVSDEAAELRDLTITAEIAEEKSSPAEDSTRRMEIQVNLMNQGGGNAQLPGRNELLHRWCAIVKSADHAELRERFFGALS